MKWIICLLIGHDDKTWFGNKKVWKECHRCGRIHKTSVKTVRESIEYFKNYDRAIDYCQKQGIDK